MKLPRIKSLFRFSLRTLLVLVVVLSVAMGMAVREARRQKERFAPVMTMDISVSSLPAKLKVLAWSPPSKKQAIDLSPLANLKKLRVLWLLNAKVSDLSPLANLATLRELNLMRSDVCDEELEELHQALQNCRIRSYPADHSGPRVEPQSLRQKTESSK